MIKVSHLCKAFFKFKNLTIPCFWMFAKLFLISNQLIAPDLTRHLICLACSMAILSRIVQSHLQQGAVSPCLLEYFVTSYNP